MKKSQKTKKSNLNNNNYYYDELNLKEDDIQEFIDKNYASKKISLPSRSRVNNNNQRERRTVEDRKKEIQKERKNISKNDYSYDDREIREDRECEYDEREADESFRKNYEGIKPFEIKSPVIYDTCDY